MSQPAAPLDTTIAVVTPENIAFDYVLAGPFRRLPAYLIDVLVRYSVIVVFAILMVFLGVFSWATLGPFAIAAWFVTNFLVTWFYGTFMETCFNGRTIGKWACGIRVIGIDGRPIDGRRAMLRNLLRFADLHPVVTPFLFDDEFSKLISLPAGMVGMVSMLLTSRMQRLGDLAAGTMVIVDERSWRLPVAKIDDPRVAALASYVPGDYRITRSMARTLAVYAERRHFLSPARRREIARHLTVPLIDRFEFRPDVDPDLLMYALYYKCFLAEGRPEIPDGGELAGFSPLRRDSQTTQPQSESANNSAAEPPWEPSAGTALGTVAAGPKTTPSTQHDAEHPLSENPPAQTG